MHDRQYALFALAVVVFGGITASAQCSYTLNAGGQVFPPAGGNGSILITAPQGCAWSVTNAPGWVTLTSSATGSGNGTLTYQVAVNAAGDRSSAITFAGASFTVEQEAGTLPGLAFIGSMAHLAAEENWTTAFTIVNKDTISAIARLSFSGDAIDPSGNGALTLPLAFPQQAPGTLPLLAASLDRTIVPNASLIVDTAGAQLPPVLVGSAQLLATGALDGFAIFHQIATNQEAVVPLESRSGRSYVLAFDNTGGLTLGVAVANISAQTASIAVIIRSDNGTVVSAPGTAISLAGNAHTSFVLADPILGFPVTANMRGTVEFDTPAGGRISVLGLRFTPPNNALTTIPAIANVGTNGGSIAHLATGNGWQTTFVLVNVGAGAAQVNLNFFDDNGSPLSLPLSFPQPGGGATTVAPAVNQVLAAGATLIVESAAPASDPAPTVGSAQLTANGNVGGFVIFRYNPDGQEAVVPLENRNANGYILAFDNTRDISTGIAINSVATQVMNIPLTVRDTTGVQIATDTITLAPNGHLSFTLGSGRYPATAGIRGTIEFDTPANAQIGVLGIRIPAAAHTFTTLPALAK
jgi:Putative binding domain, N-terminal